VRSPNADTQRSGGGPAAQTSAAASSTPLMGTLVAGVQYTTSHDARARLSEIETNAFSAIILAGIGWIALRAWFPSRKNLKK